MKNNNQGAELVKDLQKLRADRLKKSVLTSTPFLILKGLWVFAEGVALMVTSLTAIYIGHYGHGNLAWRYALTIAGVLVLLPAAHLLSKFFRSVGEVK